MVLCFSCPKVAAVEGPFLHSSFVNTLVHTHLSKMALGRSRVQGLGKFVLDSLHKEPAETRLLISWNVSEVCRADTEDSNTEKFVENDFDLSSLLEMSQLN